MANAQYCLPTYSNFCTSGDYINGVAFNTISNTGTGCSGTAPNNYTDYSGTISTTVTKGSSYNLTVTNCPSWTQAYGVWFDWNQDGDFQDAGEYTSLGTVAGGATGTVSITVPTNASPGTTRMRVRCKYSTPVMVQSDVCVNMGFGETEDYKIIISNPFCSGTYSTGCVDDYINSVSMGSINTVSTGCTGVASSYLTDYSATQRDTINRGQSKTITVVNNPNWSEYYGVWVDWNNDGDFQDAGEFFNIGQVGSGGTGTTTVLCPATALLGVTRMRVRCVYGTAQTQSTICTAYSYGEAEDYALFVGDLPPNDAHLTTVTAPASGCGLGSSETLSFSLENVGSNTITTFQACYSLDNGTPVCETFTGSVASAGTANFTFVSTLNLSAPGSHTIDTWVNLTGDVNHTNDTINGSNSTNYANISTYPSVEDFENGPNTWTSGGTANSWAFGTPAKTIIIGASSGVNAWVTGGLGTNSYNNNENSWVVSPCYDFSTLTNPWVGVDIWVESETSWDGVVLESTIDSGVTWQQVGALNDPYNWYNDGTINGLSAVGATGEGWTNSPGTGGWVRASHELSSLAGASSVRFRMHFGSDGSVVKDGFAFDNFIIAEPIMVDLGSDTSSCGDYNLLSNVPANGTFAWSTGDSTDAIVVSSTDTIEVMYLDSLGFPSMDTAMIEILTPVMPVATSPMTVCDGDTACFSVSSSFVTAVWSTGDTAYSTCATTSMMITVWTVDTNGCSGTDTTMLDVNANPVVNIGPDRAICDGDTACFNAGPGTVFTWSTGGTGSTECTSTAGTISVTVADTNGCLGSDDAVVTLNPNALAAASMDTSLCPIVAFTDNSTGGITSWAWDFGDGGTASTQNPTHDYTNAGNGTYTVTLTVTNQCNSNSTTLTLPISCLAGLENAIAQDFKLWPNPNTGSFQLETVLTSSAQVSISIYNLQGQAVFTRDMGTQTGQFHANIEMQDVAKGIYFVNLKADDQIISTKIHVE